MGAKRSYKNKAHHCHICGSKFLDYKDKHVCKIDKGHDYTESNTLVICEDCNSKVSKGVLNLLELKFNFKHLLESIGDRERAIQVRNKLYRTRQKYKEM